MLIQEQQVGEASPEFVKNRLAMQQSYMEEIWRDFDGNVRALIPLFDNEVRGTEALAMVSDYAFPETKTPVETNPAA